MNDKSANQESFRTLKLMNELESGETVSQRELAIRLGIAVGLVNSCLKNFVAKGYVRVKNYPRNRYAYLLTPKGFAEKSRLALQHLDYFTGLYTTTRRDYLNLFRHLKDQGENALIFCGVDEVAEIAYLSLREVGIDLAMVIDAGVGGEFFGYPVQPLAAAIGSDRPVILTSLKQRDTLLAALSKAGIAVERICVVGGTPPPGPASTEEWGADCEI